MDRVHTVDNTTADTKNGRNKSRRKKLLDLAIGIALVVFILILAKSLIGQIGLKREVRDASAVTNQMVDAIRKQDGKAARNLGDKKFQAQNSAANLTAQFKSATKYTSSAPTVNRQTVTNTDNAQSVSIIYKFDKPTFYVRVIVVKSDGSNKFQVVNLNANTTEKPLLNNKY